ncbi:MAG: caspase family protein [Pseudomonadota bacterium]
MMIRSILIFLLVTIATTGISAAEPRLLVFAAGLENYDHPELNKLEFAANDAQDIFDRLGVVANRDDERSKLLLADDDDETRRTEQDLRNELRQFTRRISNNDTVVVYLGGHGTLSRGGDLLILPSDYDPEEELNFVEFDWIREEFEGWIASEDLAGVKVAFIVNVCGAGNASEEGAVAMSVPTDDSIIEEVARLARELSIGEAEVAVIPATPRGRNTFERAEYGRSVFAKHLIDALDGAAAGADDVLTTGEIIGHIEVALGEDLPRNAGFASNIVLGETKRTRGRDHLTMGTALIGASRAVPDSDIAQILRDLALFHVNEVQGRNPDLAPRAQFRALQARALARTIGSDDLASRAATLPSNSLSTAERALVAEFKDGRSPAYPNFADYLKALENDPDARILVVEQGFGTPEPTVIDDILALRFGREKVWSSKINVDVEGVMGSTFMLEAASYLSKPSTTTPPLVVYSGQENVRGCGANEQKGCRLMHDWPVILSALKEANGAPFVFLYDAPYGGVLEKLAPKDLMLLLTASQENGMTFVATSDGRRVSPSDPEWLAADGTSSILFNGILNRRNDSEIFARVRSYHNKYERGEDWSLGEPVWRVVGGNDMLSAVDAALLPLDDLSTLVAKGCLHRDLVSCANTAALEETPVFAALEEAAIKDMEGDAHAAAALYTTSLEAIDALPDTPEALGAAAVHFAFDALANSIRVRLLDLTDPAGRRIVIAPIGVEVYLSPLVGDVPYALRDLEAYAAGFTEAAGDMVGGDAGLGASIHVMPNFVPRTSEELRKHLEELSEQTGTREKNVTVLIWSGRGDEFDGRRYLVTAGQEYVPSDPDLVDYTQFGTRLRDPLGHRFDLAELSEIFGDRWLFAIYDTQFDRSDLSDRRDLLLDKQLYSSLPLEPQPISELTTSRVVPAEALTRRQVHLWVDGRVTQAMVPRQTCGPGVEVAEVASPLAAGILRTLGQSQVGTYREFLRALENDVCMSSDGLSGNPVMQGEVDLPLFASGDGARFVEYFRSGEARRSSILHAAALIAKEMLTRYPEPEMELTAMALDLANANALASTGEIPGLSSPDWLREGRSRNVSISKLGNDLHALHLETDARLIAESGEFEQARERLRSAPPHVLAQRELSGLLVEFADRSLRTQPLEVLAMIEAKLREVETVGETSGLSIASDRLNALALAEQERLSEGYRIRR